MRLVKPNYLVYELVKLSSWKYGDM